MTKHEATEQHTVDIMCDVANRILSRINPIIDTELRLADLSAEDKALIVHFIIERVECFEDYYKSIAVMQENKEALTADKAEGK